MFAIDFGLRSIKVAKIRKTSDGYELENYGVTLSRKVLSPVVRFLIPLLLAMF